LFFSCSATITASAAVYPSIVSMSHKTQFDLCLLFSGAGTSSTMVCHGQWFEWNKGKEELYYFLGSDSNW